MSVTPLQRQDEIPPHIADVPPEGLSAPLKPEDSGWPKKLDLAALAYQEPEPPHNIMDGLPCGYATGFSAHGGTGKSSIVLHLAVCVALEIPFFGIPVERRRVLYLSCEDREGVMHWRLARICAYLGIDMASLAGRLEVLDLVGHDTVLWERDPKTGFTVTPAFALLAERVREYGTELLIVDGTSDTFAGNENSRTDVKRYVNALIGLVPADRGAVILIGHVDKATAKTTETTQGYSGSTAWHNSVRARWYLYPETAQGDDGTRAERTGELVLELQKSNLGRNGLEMRFTWDAEQHLFVGRTVEGPTRFDIAHRDRTEQAGILKALAGCAASVPPVVVPAAMSGPRTAYNVLTLRPELPETLRSGAPAKRRFWKQIEQLRQMHLVEERSYRRENNRHTAIQLALTEKGARQCAE